jgi:enoyl-CoA hydratase
MSDTPAADTHDAREVLAETRDKVLVITINRPDQRNAVNGAVAEGIGRALDRLDADEGLVLGVITGAGKGFCAGMDLKAFVTGERPWFEDRGFAGITQRAARKPLIAAIEGFAVAGGLEIALACDLIVAARGAKLGIPEVKRSLVAAGGGLLRLPRLLPRAVAMEMALTGDPLLAERAHELGMVNRLAEPGQALDTALALADEITPNAPLAIIGSKQILNESLDWPDAEFFERQQAISGPIFDSEDAREGATAFAEKRAPVWRGR